MRVPIKVEIVADFEDVIVSVSSPEYNELVAQKLTYEVNDDGTAIFKRRKYRKGLYFGSVKYEQTIVDQGKEIPSNMFLLEVLVDMDGYYMFGFLPVTDVRVSEKDMDRYVRSIYQCLSK